MASFTYHLSSGLPGTCANHARYNKRVGEKYQFHSDLIYTSYGNMPWWVGDEPMSFWRAEDKHERKNGAAYREQVISLPNELVFAQLVELAEKLVSRLLGNRPYEYVIHAKQGALGGSRHVHMHLMYTDRVPDDLDRTPGMEFIRYNAKNPSRGGWRKTSGGRTRMELRDEMIERRKTCADVQNEVLASYGHDSRVDHRSLQQQGIQRVPERHLGAWRVRNMTPEGIADYVDKWRTRPGL